MTTMPQIYPQPNNLSIYIHMLPRDSTRQSLHSDGRLPCVWGGDTLQILVNYFTRSICLVCIDSPVFT